MAIALFRQRKTQKYLILALIVIILLILVVIWQGFLLKPKLPPEGLRPKKIEINFEVLKSPRLEELQPFEEIPPFEEEVGRENPFVPY